MTSQRALTLRTIAQALSPACFSRAALSAISARLMLFLLSRHSALFLLSLTMLCGCLKKHDDVDDAAPMSGAEASSGANVATGGPIGAPTAWSPAPSSSPSQIPSTGDEHAGEDGSALEEDASFTNDLLDGEDDLDATLSHDATNANAADAHDAAHGDAHKRLDANDDAPLLGTKIFPDEEPQSGFRYVTSNAAKVHKAPKDGKAFVSLQRGTQVWLLGRYLDWYRIKFEDPSLGVVRQGWIFQLNVVGPRMKSCPEGWIHHDDDGGWCERECNKNTDCKALVGWKCSGTGCFYAAPSP